MKILQIFGAVVAVHLLAFIFIFASPGCQSGPRNVPTPDATLPAETTPPPTAYNANATPQPVDLGTPSAYPSANAYGHTSPTRPGSPAAAAVDSGGGIEGVSPVSTYTIVKGDSLWSVAKKNHLSVSELAKANNISTGVALRPGQKLLIPGKVATPAPKEVPATVSTRSTEKAAVSAGGSNDNVKYIVRSGESLGVIARKFQVSVGELAAANNITDPSKVRAGQQLIIPGVKASSSKANSSPASSSANRTPSTPKPAASTPGNGPTSTAPAPAASPHFEITAPPPGQDLDSGLKQENTTEVPTIKVEEPAGETPQK